ncbi:MAG: MMPL family transporter [Bacteroidaceae bacterium]|nr:MMPL family transporter [Bacteroidaceae bacterium]
MTRLFIHIYTYFRNHRPVCWLSLVALFAFFGYYAAQLHLEEDINQLMPSSKNEDGTTKLAFANLKIKDKVFLLFEATNGQGAAAPLPCRGGVGGGVSNLTSVCDEFVDSLLSRDSLSHGIGDVFYRIDEDLLPDGIDYLTEHLPAYIDTSAYAAIDTLLTREHFTRQMAQNRSDLTGEFGSMFPELVQMDPMGMRKILVQSLTPPKERGVDSSASEASDSKGDYSPLLWRGAGGEAAHFLVPDSTVCIAFITPEYSATNTGQGSTMFRMMNELIAEFAVAHPDVRISYHGTPASGFYNSTQIKHDLTTTIAGALVLVLLFLLCCFRRWDTIPLLLLPVAFGTLFGLAVMYWLKGEFSLLALGIGGVVLGVALSYVLHILTHHQYVSDPVQLLRDQVKPVLLGCITTIGSFAGLLFVNTDLLRDFGLFAAFAILGTTLFSLVYLPQLLSEKTTLHSSLKVIDRLNTYPFDRKKPLIVAILGLTAIAICAYFIGGTHFDADMHNLGYDHPMVKHSENLLSSKTYTGDKAKYFASQGRTMEEALDHFALLDHTLDSLQRLGLVKSYTHTNQLMVPLKTQQQRIDAWRHFWNPERLQTVRRLIAETAPQSGLRPEAFEPFFEIATADYEPDALYEAGIIPEGYLSTLMEQSYDGTWLCFTSVRCANDSVRSTDSDYIRICDAVSSNPHLMVLDTYYYTTDNLLQMSRDFDVLQWLSMAFVFIVLLVSFRFRWQHTLLGFAPILLSWLIVLGVMNIFGQQFNLISIIISTFIFGIGVDYSIFVMNGLVHGNLHYHKTAVLLSAIILIVTVSSMLLAVHPAIRSVGFSTLVGLISAVILSYVLQPAVFRWLNLHNI